MSHEIKLFFLLQMWIPHFHTFQIQPAIFTCKLEFEHENNIQCEKGLFTCHWLIPQINHVKFASSHLNFKYHIKYHIFSQVKMYFYFTWKKSDTNTYNHSFDGVNLIGFFFRKYYKTERKLPVPVWTFSHDKSHYQFCFDYSEWPQPHHLLLHCSVISNT